MASTRRPSRCASGTTRLRSKPCWPRFRRWRPTDFWNHTLDGLAVLGGAGLFRVFVLPRPLAELAVVADSFHTKPLRRVLQSAGRYHVLGLSLHKIRLFEGDRDSIAEIKLAPGHGAANKLARLIDSQLGRAASRYRSPDKLTAE